MVLFNARRVQVWELSVGAGRRLIALHQLLAMGYINHSNWHTFRQTRRQDGESWSKLAKTLIHPTVLAPHSGAKTKDYKFDPKLGAKSGLELFCYIFFVLFTSCFHRTCAAHRVRFHNVLGATFSFSVGPALA
jgi:hypothetical protein